MVRLRFIWNRGMVTSKISRTQEESWDEEMRARDLFYTLDSVFIYGKGSGR